MQKLTFENPSDGFDNKSFLKVTCSIPVTNKSVTTMMFQISRLKFFGSSIGLQ